MKISLSATHNGPVNVLAPVARELISRRHDVKIYATGTKEQAAGFGDLSYELVPQQQDYSSLVIGCDRVVVGLSGRNTPDGHILRSSISLKIPVIAIQDLDAGYIQRLGSDISEFPDWMLVMDKNCLDTVIDEYKSEAGNNLARRARVVGWTAFDHYAQIRRDYTGDKRLTLLEKLGIDSNGVVRVHFTQNIHPDTDYFRAVDRSHESKKSEFEYEMRATRAIFRAARELGFKLTVKPHPGEKFEKDFTRQLVEEFGFDYVPARACTARDLILAADAVTTGKSTCILEACLLDRPTGGLFPDCHDSELVSFTPITCHAVPYTQTWDGIIDVLSLINSTDIEIQRELSRNRERFSVDGKAAKRAADHIESLE